MIICLLLCLVLEKKEYSIMALSIRKPYGYSKMEKEDPEERKHRRAQFLIYKVMERADSRRKASSWSLRIRISKLKVKIGKRFRNKILSSVSSAKSGFHEHFIAHLKTWRTLFAPSPTQQPYLFKSS
ncbi:uncharacterized protein LOC129296646 [Prosopis cineraria]|uniref:uncharacterized protein LOC129292075 n=1 Tax=Prosopis cineraria TaxID=364024 RepID=UPI00240FCEBF|nr:uncharacterized protein LOC129292075 [Prosopis cineraria]XP_054791209.1 uncharacterized protein LOC129296646 [Prosopis cineraria]